MVVGQDVGEDVPSEAGAYNEYFSLAFVLIHDVTKWLLEARIVVTRERFASGEFVSNASVVYDDPVVPLFRCLVYECPVVVILDSA